jgi:hypothetical protein
LLPWPGIAEIREPSTFQVAELDTYTPLLSLPYLFGTTLETIPALDENASWRSA